MRRITSILLLSLFMVGLLAGTGRAETAATAAPTEPVPVTPRILLDGYPLTFPVPPMIVSGRIMVPFRAIAESLGVNIIWHGETRTIEAAGLGREVRLTIDQKEIWVDGVAVPLDVPPMLVNSRTLVPLRAFSSAFQAKVGWEPASWTATLESPSRPMRMLGFYAIASFSERQYVSSFSDMAYGWATLNKEGKVSLSDREYRWPEPAGEITGEALLADTARQGVKRYLMIHATDRTGDLTNLVLNASLADKVGASVAAVVREKGFDGAVLDLEGLGLSEKDEQLARLQQGFTRLVAGTADALHADGKSLVVSVPPLNGWYHGYDYAALAQKADFLQIMAHDYIQDGKPEPLNLVDEAIRLALAALKADEHPTARQKLLLGLLVGPEGSIETAATIPQKVGLAKRYNLAGISLWRLGQVGEERMNALKAVVSPLLHE